MELKVIKPQIYKQGQSAEYIKQYIAKADQLIEYLYDLPVDERLEYDDDSVMGLQEWRRTAQKDLDELEGRGEPKNYKYLGYDKIKSEARKQGIATIVLVKQRMDYLRSILGKIDEKIDYLYDLPEHEKFLTTELEEQAKKLKENIEHGIQQLDREHKNEMQNQKVNFDGTKEKALAYPIADLISSKPAKKGGNLWMYKSPLRDERTASFAVYTVNNTAYDFGTGTQFDSISLYMALNNCNFITAVKALQ